jgi:hypothetical protein
MVLRLAKKRHLASATDRGERGGCCSPCGTFRVIRHPQTHGLGGRLSENAMRRPYSTCIASLCLAYCWRDSLRLPYGK